MRAVSRTIRTLERLLGRYARPLREFREFRRRRRPALPVAAALAGGFVDHVTIQPDGAVSAEGWCPDLAAWRAALALRLDGDTLAATHAFRVTRTDLDIRVTGTGSTRMAGAVAEWIVPAAPHARPAALAGDGRDLVAFTLPPIPPPAYGGLRTEPRILHREHIYGSGPPVDVVSPELLDLARHLPPPILDFGCGAGVLVRELRRLGVAAFGIELDDARIRGHLLDEARPHVTLYDGRLPAPFETGAFGSVVCAEVVEHMPDPEAALAEIARLSSRALLITVPDMSSIPRGFQHGIVPWHLLEATHVNFFTQHSLERALAAWATRVEMARIGRVRCDRADYFTSLVALATRSA